MSDEHQHQATDQAIEAVEAYRQMMALRAELGPVVERASRLGRDLIESRDPSIVTYLARITETDQRYADQQLSTDFQLVIGDVDLEAVTSSAPTSGS